MSRLTFLKMAAAAGGFLFLCAVPRLAFGVASPADAAPPAPVKSAPGGRPAAPPDLLEGLTLTADQKVTIDRIRADTKTRVADVSSDRQMSPEAADAMRRGYQRLENGRILEALTPEQQQQVRKRIAAWRTTAQKPQYPMRRTTVSQQAAPAQ